MQENKAIISMQNNTASLGIKKAGGAITCFCLKEGGINPLSFWMKQEADEEEQTTDVSKQEATANNGNRGTDRRKMKTGDTDDQDACFEGHFVCLPRWGDPSPGEKKAGLHKHGAFSRLPWNTYQSGNKTYMQATSGPEGITLDRVLSLDPQQACFEVEERITNFHARGCLYDMVQHPTLAAPFLNANTVVDCNATTGFDESREHYDEEAFTEWPVARNRQGTLIDLSRPIVPYSGVYSFIVDPLQPWGWITAYSPQHELLIGYVWPRAEYPWINLWLHYAGDRLLYRGLEFGTTGVHKPFNEILDRGLTRLLNEKTYRYLDAGAQESRRYFCFLQKIPEGYNGVQQVEINSGQFVIREKGTSGAIYLPHSFKLN